MFHAIVSIPMRLASPFFPYIGKKRRNSAKPAPPSGDKPGLARPERSGHLGIRNVSNGAQSIECRNSAIYDTRSLSPCRDSAMYDALGSRFP